MPLPLICLLSKNTLFFDPNLEFRVPTSSAYDCGLRITSSPKHKEKEKLCIRKRKICTSLFENHLTNGIFARKGGHRFFTRVYSAL